PAGNGAVEAVDRAEAGEGHGPGVEGGEVQRVAAALAIDVARDAAATGERERVSTGVASQVGHMCERDAADAAGVGGVDGPAAAARVEHGQLVAAGAAIDHHRGLGRHVGDGERVAAAASVDGQTGSVAILVVDVGGGQAVNLAVGVAVVRRVGEVARVA